jgi:polar amino acid transport system substrate-binding protein
VDDLKDFARRDVSELYSLVDINLIAQTAVRLVENTINNSTSRFVQDYNQDIPKIKGNSQRIEQVLVNLILNACQALNSSDDGITLCTKYDRELDMILVIVKDDGEGIAPENLPHLTDPFFTTKREYGGTGLGLYVSAGIIKEHQGTLRFSSMPGEGTTVTLGFPAANASEGWNG